MCILVLSILQVCGCGHDTFCNYYSIISHHVHTHLGEYAAARTLGLWIVREYVPHTVCPSTIKDLENRVIAVCCYDNLCSCPNTIADKWHWYVPTGNDFHCQSLLVSCFNSTVTHVPHESSFWMKAIDRYVKFNRVLVTKSLQKHPVFYSGLIVSHSSFIDLLTVLYCINFPSSCFITRRHMCSSFCISLIVICRVVCIYTVSMLLQLLQLSSTSYYSNSCYSYFWSETQASGIKLC